MDEKQFLEILKKYRSGKASEEEISLLNAYYGLFEARDSPFAHMSLAEEEMLRSDIKEGIDQQLVDFGRTAWHRPFHLRTVWAAASIVALAIAALVLFYGRTERQPLEKKFARYDVRPGKKGIILTLADGKKMVIQPSGNGQLAVQGNTTLSQRAGGLLVYGYDAAAQTAGNAPQYNSISVPEGAKIEVILPDGSKAFVNANSTLRYPTAFQNDTRQVELQGEGYFEVTHNKTKPFIVKTGTQEVRVLGTHFDVNAYNDEGVTKTTLLEGSVKVSASGRSVMLRPGEQSELTNVSGAANFSLKDSRVDTAQIVAWKNGYFQYHEANIKTIMRDFSRWYGVNVVYRGNVHERLFSGSIHRDLSLLQALDLLNYTNIHFTIEAKQITIISNN